MPTGDAGFRRYSLRVLRRFIEEFLPTESALEAFCLDTFGKDFFKVVASMSDRPRKLTHILIERGTNPQSLVAALEQYDPARFVSCANLLDEEPPAPPQAASVRMADVPDPLLLQRLYGVGAPLLSCDRGNQWQELEPLLCNNRHQLIFLPGAHDQAHEFFLRRIEKGFRRDPPRQILRVSWRQPGTLSQPPFPSTMADAHTALARTLGTPHRHSLPRVLATALSQHNLILLLPPLCRSLRDERLMQHHGEWLSVPLASLDTRYRCKFIQPIEWRASSRLMRLLARVWRQLWPDYDLDWVDLALSETDARTMMKRIAENTPTAFDVSMLSDLLPITQEDIHRFLNDIVLWGEGTANPEGERRRLTRHVLSRADSSREILSLLLDLLPDAPSLEGDASQRDFHVFSRHAPC